MTVYKAFRNLIIALAIVGIIVAGSLIGFSAYRIYDYAQNSQYVVSKLGSTGDEVNKIQKKLSSLGFYNGSVDGVYGNDTKSAVKAFQKSCGITADGICGKTTLLYLGLSGGGAVKFLRKFFGMTYPEAVRSLLGESAGQEILSAAKEKPKPEPKNFSPPPPHSDMRRLYAYLLNERGIDRDIIHTFTHAGLMYEDAVNHNVCFVGKDDTGTVRHLHKRATNPLSDFKGNITGSDAEYAFHYIGKSDRLYVFEAPIDLLAFLTLYPAGWQDHSYVALCSTAGRAALRMLKDYPQLKQVYLCLDHDSAGIEGAYRIADSIHSLGEYQVYRLFPAHKDWDEDLKARMGKDAIPAGEHPKLAYIAEKTAELKEMCLEDTDEYIKYKRMPADLFDDTMRKLERLKKQIIASDLTEKKESYAAEMAKTAVAFCVLRSRQIGKPVTAEALADQMAKMYKPHRDKQNISSQLDSIGYDLKEIREDADKSDAQTKTEIEWQIRRTLLLGLSCLQLGGSISLSPTVAEPTVGQAISY